VELGIEKVENVVLPERDGSVRCVMSVIGFTAKSRVNLQQVRLVQVLKLFCESMTDSCVVIVGAMNQHDVGVSVTDSGEQTVTEFGRVRPGICGRAESDRSADAGITFGCQQREWSAERMSNDSNGFGIDARRCLEERQRGHNIIELLGGQQNELQMLPRALPVCRFLALQDFLDEKAPGKPRDPDRDGRDREMHNRAPRRGVQFP